MSIGSPAGAGLAGLLAGLFAGGLLAGLAGLPAGGLAGFVVLSVFAIAYYYKEYPTFRQPLKIH